MRLTPGTRLGPYEIIAPLGAGGMGEVYRATDTRLGRAVAVKVLPRHHSGDSVVRARFEREARTVSALNHPHICTVYDVGVHDDQPYLVMELLSGQTLAQVIGRKPMPIDRVMALGEQIADALDAAHRAGIVHRDLKPGNLFVNDRGDIKVLDFGLAKMQSGSAVDPASEDTPTVAQSYRTEIGTTLGTVAYMSPEQARAEPVDARSDLFSLGVVLYEMATGRLPFEGKSHAEMFAAILKTDPTPPSELNPEVPARLEGVILRALEKDPALRYQSADALREGLKGDGSGRSAASQRTAASARGAQGSSGSRRGLWIGLAAAALVVIAGIGFLVMRGSRPSGSAKEGTSIAVLPFTDMSPARDQEYFSDGISEELLNLLAQVPQLQVTARTSSFSFKGKNIAIPEIAKRLHVRHVLEGSVRKAGNTVRITAQLIDASTDTHIWSQTYDRTLDDVFKVQDEIAADVVRQLKVKILDAPPRVRETTPEAYAFYLQAVQMARKRSRDGYVQSDSLLRRVQSADPHYAAAWSLLASNLINEVTIGQQTPEQGFRLAREAALRALEIDPEFARAHASLGSIAIFQNDLPAAAEHFQRALELDPTDLFVLGNSSAVLKSLGRLDDAIALDEAVVLRDPVNTNWSFNLAAAQNWAGRYDQAIVSLRTVLSLSPEFGGAHLVLGESLLGKGDAAGALAEIRQETSEPFRMMGLPMAFHALGRTTDSDTALAALVTKYGKDAPYDIAYIYAYRGDRDRAFEWLDKAAAAHDPSMVLILVENLFANLHSDPRWLPFLRKLGKGPEQLEKITFRTPAVSRTPTP
jgi:TolB-like protein/Flp pilus assembly protein TadD